MKTSSIILLFLNSLEFCSGMHQEDTKEELYNVIEQKYFNGEYLELSELYKQESTHKEIKEGYLSYPELSLIGMLVSDDQEIRDKYFLTALESDSNSHENKLLEKVIKDVKRELFIHDIMKSIRKDHLNEYYKSTIKSDIDYYDVIKLIIDKECDSYKEKNIELVFAMFHLDCFLDEIKDPSYNGFYFKIIDEKPYFMAFFNCCSQYNSGLFQEIEDKNPELILLYKRSCIKFTPFNLIYIMQIDTYVQEINNNAEKIQKILSFSFDNHRTFDFNNIDNSIKNGEHNDNLLQYFRISVRLGNFSFINNDLLKESDYAILRKLLKNECKNQKNFFYFKKGLELILISKNKKDDYFEPYFKYYLDFIEDEKMKNEYKNVILDKITECFNSYNLKGFQNLVKLLAGYVDDSYNEIFSNIKLSLNQNYVIDRFSKKDFANISNMIIIFNNTIKTIEENCSKEI